MSLLSSPVQQKTDAVLLTSTSQAKNWVQDLPLTNMGEVTRVLYQSLVALNQHPLAPAVRIEITEVLLPYVNIALENLDRHFSTRSFPLPGRSQKVFDLKQALQLELAGSYQLAALDMLTRGGDSQKRLTIAIGRAIRYMGRALVNSYGIYVKCKPNIWHDIHHLYLLACENLVQKKSIPASADGKSDNFTIEAYYKLFNLVALGVPNSLRQGEVDRLEKFFSTVINKVDILDDVDNIKGDYAHIALLNSDEPAALMPASEILSSPTSRIFDISTVEAVLRKFIDTKSDSVFDLQDDRFILNRGLANRLLTRLTVSSSRKNKRFDRDDVAGVVMRLNDVFSVVAASGITDEEVEDISNAEDDLYEKLSYGEAASSPWVELDIETSLEDADVEIQPWHIENSSAKGYCFRQKVIEPSSARVGEVIAVRDPADQSDHWQIGVIRWMDFYRDKGLCFGTELLSSKAISISINAIANRDVPQRLPINGLMLPKIEGERNNASLLLPGHMFMLEDILKIEIGEKVENVQLIGIDECLGSFAYCQYIVIDQDDDQSRTDDNDFSDVWDFI